MRLLITADPYLPVPPTHYGGIERVIALLVDGLVARGHTVTLLAHPASRTSAALLPYGVPPHTGAVARVGELLQAARAAWSARDLDLVHSFGRLAALAPILPMRFLPKVQSYQRAVSWPGVARAVRLAGSSLRLTACSSSMHEGRGSVTGTWHTVYNAVDTVRLVPSTAVDPDAPLVFLGRLEWIKGVHHAIAIARGAGRRLIIAGNRVRTKDGDAYFTSQIAPHLDDHFVTYVGEVDDEAKAQWLASAAALLMPIEWDEPFGIVMAEALACGTPVIGFGRGAVPEVVRHGTTGFVGGSVDDAVAAVGRLGEIDRAVCRADAEQRFSPGALVDAYLRVYAEATAGAVSRA
jgi:glycosyltransferase involved in cell wall biosynthesis